MRAFCDAETRWRRGLDMALVAATRRELITDVSMGPWRSTITGTASSDGCCAHPDRSPLRVISCGALILPFNREDPACAEDLVPLRNRILHVTQILHADS